MKRYILLFLLLTSSLWAQNDTYKFDPKLAIHIAPLALVDFYDGTSARLTIDAKLYKNWYLGLEGGTYTGGMSVIKINPSGYLIKPEIRFRVGQSEGQNHYIGFEYQYKQQSYDLRDSISVNDGPHFEKKYAMNRKMNCFTLKYTYQQEWGDHFIISCFFGLGVRFLDSRNNLTDEEDDGLLTAEENGSTMGRDFIRATGDFATINVTSGFKIGYIIF